MEEIVFCQRDCRGVMTVTLNRPKVHNAFNEHVIAKLGQVFKEIEDDDDTRLVLLQGEGKSFCAGADLNWMRAVKDYTQEENYADAEKMSDMFRYINSCPVPVIAKAQGAILGGGTGLLAVCDYVIAEEKCKIGFTEVKLGLIPAVISPYVVAKIGESNARGYFFSGEIFGPTKAQEMGLVHKTVPREELDQAAAQVMETFLQAGPLAAKRMKKFLPTVLKTGAKRNYKKIGEITSKETADVRASAEAQAGMSALLEKKSSPWLSK